MRLDPLVPPSHHAIALALRGVVESARDAELSPAELVDVLLSAASGLALALGVDRDTFARRAGTVHAGTVQALPHVTPIEVV